MDITTKFNNGDSLYFISKESKVAKGTVVRVDAQVDDKEPLKINYFLRYGVVNEHLEIIEQSKCYASQHDLLAEIALVDVQD